MSPPLRAPLPLALAFALLACGNSQEAAPVATTSAPRPTATASAPPSASSAPPVQSAAAPRDPYAGTWEGRFEAKKGSVTLPAKVKDKVLAADDGKTAVGEGKVELTVGAGGEVRGKATGALGACTVSGKVDEGMLRARIEPDDPRAEGVMSGVLMGRLEGDTIRATIQAAGPDATRVREASLDLKRK